MAVFGRTFSGSNKWLWLWIYLLLLSSLFSMVPAQIIRPSSSSRDLPLPNSLHYQLRIEQRRRHPSRLLALTPSLANSSNPDAKRFNINGTLRIVDPANADDFEDSDFAFLSCDGSAYSGNLGADDTLERVIAESQPAAIVLYSTESKHCSYAGVQGLPEFDRIFTLLDPDSALWFRNQLELTGSSQFEARIMSDLAAIPTAASPDAGQGQNSAMIILYSITGVIAALFLGIIIIGAIRAHRHPERYGPRTGTGLPRQSRARGIARAMLETIPIVKFGDQDESNRDVPNKLDVEMTAGHDGSDANASHDSINQISTGDNTVHGGLNENGTAETTGGNDASTETPGPATTPEESTPPGPDPKTSHVGSLGCSICTDDFVKGQDIRVLPCNHKFHPECVDPWLVNVSGTCPLCRIDLHPPLPEHGDPDQDETEHGSDHPASAEPTAHEDHHRHRRAISSYIHHSLNARRMRDASVEERIATLRRLRREQQNNTDVPPSITTPQTPTSRSHRLSSRLRGSLRIRTRQHDDASASGA